MSGREESYIKVAKDTEVFNPQEIAVLREMVGECLTIPGKNYFLFDEQQDAKILGFVIFGRIPLTEFSWDVYWLVVDKMFQGKGVGKKLLVRVEDFIAESQARAILRIETSARKDYVRARGLYIKQGFIEIGRILHFYAPNDNLVIFYKEVKHG